MAQLLAAEAKIKKALKEYNDYIENEMSVLLNEKLDEIKKRTLKILTD